MTLDTHGRWPLAAAALAPPAWALALRQARKRGDGAWIAHLGLPILLVHQTEEWVRPGGFLPFCNERLLGSDQPTWPGLATASGLMAVHAAAGAIALRRSGRLSRREKGVAAAVGAAFSIGLPVAMKLRMQRA